MSEQKKPNNLKTGLILASIALVFFISVFVRHTLLG
ncbi:cytochrome oxidase small assembly protein [Janthinobacterium fluminis]|uniref:Cytochrome oxidase small assembly protein n=1 Tax=Janthinobacterium fluminis TaxID=2987524 RepID=A0ABT5K480_9BURK|nr:cytochrome oxidase small assembly protein [Janthinobacterium fluminis]MDC8759785.1 cytochrome oxidase small assembly protein [Janthinobacterium fluminis]